MSISVVDAGALGRKALGQTAVAVAVMGALILVPAGTLRFWQAWLWLAIFGLASAAIILYLQRTQPDLMARRTGVTAADETRSTQKLVHSLIYLLSPLILIVPGLDKRLVWSTMPAWLCVVGAAGLAFSFWLMLRVFRENRYTAAVVRVEEGQQVISTGPYRLVRHPFYLCALIMFISTPLALGSWWGLLPALAPLPLIFPRILDEERVLQDELSGYTAYMQRTRSRLIPGVW